MLESYVENKVCEWAKKNGWLVRKLQWIGREGAPDRLFLKNGCFLLIEFKQPGKKPRPSQRAEIKRLRQYGAKVAVVDNVEAGISFLRDEYAAS